MTRVVRVVHVELEPDDICGRRSRTMCGVVVDAERCDGAATCKRCLAVGGDSSAGFERATTSGGHMSTMQERRRYTSGIWTLDGMLDDPVSLCLTEEYFVSLLGRLPDRLYETEIRKACRVLGRLQTWVYSTAGSLKLSRPVDAHLEALLAMDSEPGSDETEPKAKAKKGSVGNAPAKKAIVSRLSAPEVTSRWGD